ncbi:hypothetical protein [Enhygromyxa salina]|uniref:hypothetical protein n=1 Tax=Enhygromyxa salina TaxID=215803 RepID=UPI0015E6B91C|nr:hypothetical protein [Enhygromyxa salina]
MKPLRPVVMLLAMTLTGCGAEQDGWTRVVELGEGDDQLYSIVHVDPLTDSCVAVTLRGPASTYPPDEDLDVRVKGADLVVWSANGMGMGGRACTNGFMTTGGTTARGQVEFEDFVGAADSRVPCRISFELTIAAFDGQTYEISAREFPILDVGCPRPGVYASEHLDLDAAYGVHNGVGNLVIASWDPQHEACVWARFLSSNDATPPKSEVEVVNPWVYGGLRFGLMERERCVASELVVPPIDPPYDSDSAPALRSSGSLSFVTSEIQELAGGQLLVPCTLDVDLSLQSLGRYQWTPDDVGMRESGVVVAGACE